MCLSKACNPRRRGELHMASHRFCTLLTADPWPLTYVCVSRQSRYSQGDASVRLRAEGSFDLQSVADEASALLWDTEMV
jgi:hypothetical protein